MRHVVRGLALSSSGLFLLVAFQNCGGKNMSFSSTAPALVAKVDVTGSVDDPSVSPDPGPLPSPSASASSGPVGGIGDGSGGGSGGETTPPEENHKNCGHKKGHHHEGEDESGSANGDDHEDDESSDDGIEGAHDYVCILNGAGNSVKIGIVAGQLEGKTATPQDVCMSKHACNDIISQSFEVKGPSFRGFCKQKSPQVVELYDSEIESLIDNH